MKRVLVDEIQNNMILAKEVCGRAGNVLLSKGTALSVAMARRLKNWEVTFVVIDGGEDAESTEAKNDAGSIDELRTHLEKKFAPVMHHSIMKQIFAAVLQFRINKGNG